MDNIIEKLKEALDLIHGYVDIEDGGQEGPRPNKAMKASTLLGEAIAELMDKQKDLLDALERL